MKSQISCEIAAIAMMVMTATGTAWGQGLLRSTELATPPNAPASAPKSTTPAAGAKPATDFEKLSQGMDCSGYPSFVRSKDAVGTVRVLGSTTVASVMARVGEELARASDGKLVLAIEGGGSGVAIKGLIEGRCELAALSRNITPAEIEAFTTKFGYAPTTLTIAVDAVAIFVNRRNPITQMTMAQLERTMTASPAAGARARTWGELGVAALPDSMAAMPITVFGQREGSGTYSLVLDIVLRGKPFGSWVRGEPVPSSVTQGVAAEAGGLGFASIFYDNARSHPVALSRDGVNFVEPSYTNVINGTYPLSRGLHVVMNLPPGGSLSAPVTEVISYILSRNGQELVSVDGNYPLTGEQVETSRRKLLRAPATPPGGPSTSTSPSPGPAAAAPAGGAPVNGSGQPK